MKKRILLNLKISILFWFIGFSGFSHFFCFDYMIGEPIPTNNLIGLFFLLLCGLGPFIASFVIAFKGNSDYDSQIILTLGMPTTYIALIALVAFAAAIRFYVVIGAF